MKVRAHFYLLAALSGKMNEEKRLQLLMIEKNEMDNENQRLREQLNFKHDELERLNSKVMELEHETSQVRVLKTKVDELMSKNFQKDQSTKEKEETLFNLKREVESLRSDVRNMEHIEGTLKAEIEDLLDKRKTLEDINQNLKNQICECNIAIRQMASQFDAIKRENMALTSNIEIFRRSEEQLRAENRNLKDLINNIESERIHYRAISEQLQRELAYSKQDSSSYNPNDYQMLHYNGPQNYESFYQGIKPEEFTQGMKPKMPNTNYEYMMPQSELSHSFQPSQVPSQNFFEIYKPPGTPPTLHSSENTPRVAQSPQIPLVEELKSKPKSQNKLPMHLASSVTFEYPEEFDQFYRKNQDKKPSPTPTPDQFSSSINPNIREDAQKAYFSSNLEGVFNWSGKHPRHHPSEEHDVFPQQIQGSQNGTFIVG
jgi:myosin heavy subunit